MLGCVLGIVVTVICIRSLIPLAERLNLVDYPGGRKQHRSVKPLIGGIAVFIGFAAAMLSLPISLQGYRPFAAGGLLLILLGILDDMHELSARARLGGEILAGLIMTIWAGIELSNLGALFFNGNLLLSWFAVPFTIFAIVGLINAVNMLDGSDGLAGSITIIQLFLFFIVAQHAHLFIEAHVILLLTSALLGFLIFNFPFSKNKSARIFMGDAGSMFLGYALSWFAISLSQQPHAAIYPVGVLWILGLTLWDALRVILSRLIAGKSPFKPDRNHLHHILHDYGLSPRNTCFVVSGVSLVLGLIGVIGQYQGLSSSTLFIAYVSGFIIYCTVIRFGLQRRETVVTE